MHVFELVGEGLVDGGLMVCVMEEVHVDCLGAGIWILCRVHSYEVLVLDEYGLCAGDIGVRASGL